MNSGGWMSNGFLQRESLKLSTVYLTVTLENIVHLKKLISFCQVKEGDSKMNIYDMNHEFEEANFLVFSNENKQTKSRPKNK